MTTSATLSLGYVAVYVVLVGVASFVEKPAGRGGHRLAGPGGPRRAASALGISGPGPRSTASR